jgi:hypothetical protein
MEDYKLIIIKLYENNKHLGFIDESDYIKKNTNKLIGKYWKWDESLPDDILFGLGGSIIFTNDSIYVNEIKNRYLYSSLVRKHKNHDLQLRIYSFLFSYNLSYKTKKDKDPLSISLNLKQFNFFVDVFNLFQKNYDNEQKKISEENKRKEEERLKENKRKEEEEILIKKEIRRLKDEENKKKQMISQIILILFEKLRKIKLEENKISIISNLDKDGNGEIDLVDDEILNKILVNNQKIIIEIDKIYIQKFVKISMYIKTKRSNIQNIFTTIKDTKNDTELNELLNLLENQRYTYDLLVFHSINMITSLVESDLITFYQIYESFDELGVFNSNWENEVSGKLSNIGNSIKELMYSIYQMENKIISSIGNLTYITQSSNVLNLSVNNQLRKINSTLDYSNYMSRIQNYKMYNLTL